MNLCLNLLILLVSFNGFKYSLMDEFDDCNKKLSMDAILKLGCIQSTWGYAKQTDDVKCCAAVDQICALNKAVIILSLHFYFLIFFINI